MESVTFAMLGGGWRSEFYTRIANAAPERFCLRAVWIRNPEKAERYRGRYFKDTLSCREQLGDVCMAAGDFREAGEEYEAVRSFLRREYPYQEEWIRRIDEKLSGSRTARPHMAGENRGDRM